MRGGGIIGLVTGAGWLDGNAGTGLRNSLIKEFSAVYVFNCRGNINIYDKKEGGNLFGNKNKTPNAITFLVKKPGIRNQEPGQIYYYDIGDYLNTAEKLKSIAAFKSVINLPLSPVTPNAQGDWLNARAPWPPSFMPLAAWGAKGKSKINPAAESFFTAFSLGPVTGRDSWCVNFSRMYLEKNITNTVNFYNKELARFKEAEKLEAEKLTDKKLTDKKINPDDFVNRDSGQFHWDRTNLEDIRQGRGYAAPAECDFRTTAYRPFCRQWLYFNPSLNACVYQMPQLFPTPAAANLLIGVLGLGAKKDFSVLITRDIPNLHCLESAQWLPRWYYEPRATGAQDDLFIPVGDGSGGYCRREAISGFILTKARGLYADADISEEDIFYYVYGLLHSPDYRAAFKNTFSKELPRLPLVKDFTDFRALSRAGRQLGELHLNYEDVPPCPLVTVSGREAGNFRVDKMCFAKKGKENCLDTIIYNDSITVSNIPAAAYDYQVNGRAAVKWVMANYQVKTDKDTHIGNDPNYWAAAAGKPGYILDLLLSVINVALQTQAIIAALPKIDCSGEDK